MNAKLRALLDLGRVSNLPSVVTNVVAAWVLASGELGFGLIPVVVGAVLLYLGGATLNDAVDVKFDRENRPERPIPAGVFGVVTVWAIGIGYLLVGVLLLIGLTGAAPIWVLALAVVIVVYDLVHKRWAGGVFVMGSCRLFLYLLAASAAVDGLGLGLAVLAWAAALFLYIVGLTFAARGESTGGGVSKHAVAFLAAPVIAAGVSLVWGGGGVAFSVCLMVYLGWVGICFWQLKGERAGRVGRFVGGLLAGIPLIDGLALASVRPGLALLLLLALPVSLLLQRAVAAT